MPVTNLPYDRRLNGRAKELRHEMTPQERKLWYAFLRDYPIKIYKQRVIEFFIVDCYDKERTAMIEAYGVQVLRFSNREVDSNLAGVCQTIAQTIHTRLTSMPPAQE